MTRVEAEAEAKELNERDPQWFCPLIPGPCNKECVNFMLAFVEAESQSCNGKRKSVTLHKVDDDDFYVDGWACTNGQFLSGSQPYCSGE